MIVAIVQFQHKKYRIFRKNIKRPIEKSQKIV